MPSSRYLVLGLAALGLAGALAFALSRRPDGARAPTEPPPKEQGAGGEKPPAPAGQPRLAVLVFFDQLRGDYLTRWDKLFEDGGFHRLETEGAWFQNCHYPYSFTVTAAGHASVATGCSPETHGIIANDWYDPVARKEVYCVAPGRGEQQVPPPAGGKEAPGASPHRLLAPTLADALKEATGGKGRVVCLSLKDRSAVLPGGRRPDACYWADKDGRFVTSSYYPRVSHRWVRDFNDSRFADKWLGASWERLRPRLDYALRSGPDDVAGEAYLPFSRTFPHQLGRKGGKPDRAYHAALATSPFGNDVLLELARRAIDAEKLGQRDTPDLLVVSFSSNDLVGHCWGPDSQEVLDTTLRSDGIVKALLDHLDRRVGKGRYVVALTSDHGVCPLPEVSKAQGREAGRVDPRLMLRQAEEHLDGLFPDRKRSGTAEPWVEWSRGPLVYLNRSLLGRLRLKTEDVEQELAKWLARQPGVQAAYTWFQLQSGFPALDELGEKVRRSFHPRRSPDVTLVEKPYNLLTTYLVGTNHGTPHAYDTHVPLLAYGPGIRPGVRRELIAPQAAPVILARALGIKPPAEAKAPPPEDLFTKTGR
jgi:predicted AlkP superfamily pyrophosphatase or phosphodiesterase